MTTPSDLTGCGTPAARSCVEHVPTEQFEFDVKNGSDVGLQVDL